MAPEFSSFGERRGTGFSNTSRAPSSVPQDVEVIEIDDDDDEEMEGTGGTDEDEDEEEEGSSQEYEDDDDMEVEEETGEDNEIEDEEDEESEESEEDEQRGKQTNGLNGSALNGNHKFEEQWSGVGTATQNPVSLSPGFAATGLLNSDVKETLHPLQDTAERVLKQIESFAKSLDTFRKQSHAKEDSKSFHEVCDLVKKYQSIAETNVKELSKPPPPRKTGRAAFGGSREAQKQISTGKVDEQVKRWQLEAETWNLVHQLLSVADPESHLRAKRSQETALQSLHRYSSDREVWEKFLETDHFAMESVMVLKWLEKSASIKDLDTLISDLEREADRGQGLWAHGWLYTKEEIKGAKRLRSWPQPLEPQDSGLTASLLSSEKREPLITQLDPDAVTRQGLGLQKQDQFYEQATWLTFWKMLRSGKSWSHIRQWSQERLEGWRAVSACGSSVESTGKTNGPSDHGLARMMNCRSQESWRSACSALANDPHTDRYERAVYALLAGETEPAYAVCQGWSDHLFVFYNHLILSRYRDFCKQFQRKLSYASGGDVSVKIERPAYDSVLNFLDNLKKDEKIGAEARNPYRSIQAAVLSKGYDAFFYHQASAASTAAASARKPTLVPLSAAMANVDDSSLITANDESSLRIATHLFIFLNALGLVRSDTHFVETASINIVRYIDYLRESEKTELIPLYASLLPQDMGNLVLGKVLVDVVDHEQREKQVQKMASLGINASAVLRSQWNWVLSETAPEEVRRKPVKPRSTVTEEKNGPGSVLTIERDLISSPISSHDQQLIRCLEWHRYVPGQWPSLCSRALYLYKRFIIASSLSSARELSTRLRFSQIPISIHGTEREEQSTLPQNGIDAPISPRKRARSKSPVKSANHHRRQQSSTSLSQSRSSEEQLYIKAQTIGDLEQLVSTFDALEQWGNYSSEYEDLSGSARKGDPKRKLQQYLDRITDNIQPLCDDWLNQPIDDTEASELETIRTTFLPEAIMLYHSALYFAGHTFGREIFAQCMTLATVVAGSPTLTECFVASGRMTELVHALALSSMAIISLPKEAKLKRKLPQGASLDIWKVKPIEEEVANFTLHLDNLARGLGDV